MPYLITCDGSVTEGPSGEPICSTGWLMVDSSTADAQLLTPEEWSYVCGELVFLLVITAGFIALMRLVSNMSKGNPDE